MSYLPWRKLIHLGGRILHIIVFALALAGCASASEVTLPTVTTPDSGLFLEAFPPPQSLPTDRPDVLRSRLVRIDFAQLADTFSVASTGQDAHTPAPSGISLTLNLFDDVLLRAILDRVDYRSPQSYTWIGHLDGVELSLVSLSIEGEVMIGNVTLPGAYYQIRYLQEDLHLVNEINQEVLPP